MKKLQILGAIMIVIGVLLVGKDITLNSNNSFSKTMNLDTDLNDNDLHFKDYQERVEETQKKYENEYEESVRKMYEDPEGWQQDFQKKYEETKKMIEDTRVNMQ